MRNTVGSHNDYSNILYTCCIICGGWEICNNTGLFLLTVHYNIIMGST
jgi:hypothetical protein